MYQLVVVVYVFLDIYTQFAFCLDVSNTITLDQTKS